MDTLNEKPVLTNETTTTPATAGGQQAPKMPKRRRYAQFGPPSSQGGTPSAVAETAVVNAEPERLPQAA